EEWRVASRPAGRRGATGNRHPLPGGRGPGAPAASSSSPSPHDVPRVIGQANSRRLWYTVGLSTVVCTRRDVGGGPMDLIRIGDKVVDRNRIYRVVDRILELRASGLSQQDVAEK